MCLESTQVTMEEVELDLSLDKKKKKKEGGGYPAVEEQ